MLNVNALTVTMQRNPSKRILDNITFDVKDGEILAILGPSGAGKTTLLRCLALLHQQTLGTITFNETPIDTLAAGQIGIVFQSFNLFPHLTVIENMLLAPTCHKKGATEALLDKAQALLAQFGLTAHAGAHPHNLSGGQKQRVAIARALMMDPPVLLFDEPTSALDPELINEVSEIIKALRQPKRVILVVTHEVRLARHVADHILFLDNGVLLDNVSRDVFFGESGDGLSPRAQTFLSNLS
ncbi:MAG: ATP-binding cassette domain-containing protein [Alphaproteobacteria bacterium]|jgi:polar amino acid transport system ATP-binding protein|nr:ATP-binding cassette domain-containing protein [Alphaproteobacteria bacterium]MDP5012267.1 ATP-binding cassette domain-containing protein [Alphaproteobacteria bacterium]